MWVARLGAGDQNAISGLSGSSSSRRLRMGEDRLVTVNSWTQHENKDALNPVNSMENSYLKR